MFRSAALFLGENVALLARAAVAALLALTSRPRRNAVLRSAITESPWILMMWIALCQLPLAIVGRVKVGGDVNAYSHSLYFLLLGTALLLWKLALQDVTADEAAGGATGGTAPEKKGLLIAESATKVSRRLLVGAPPLILLAVVSVQQRADFGDLLDRLQSPHPYTLAARYAAAHPGTIYFPRMNLVTGLVEDRLDHQVEGLNDLIGAGHPPTAEHFRARMPPNLEKVAILVDGQTDQIRMLDPYLELERLPDDPELPGFWLLRATPRLSPVF